MPEPASPLIIRKSIAVLVSKILALQLVVVLLYVLIRLSKYWFFGQFFADNDYHHLNFWLGIMVFLVLLLLQTIILVSLVLEWFFEYYDLRKDLIVHTKGVFRKKEDIYSLKTVEAGNVLQSFTGKIFKFGTVRIYSPVLKREYFLSDIPDPHNIRAAVIDLLSVEDSNDKKIIPKEHIERRR
jgi:hypothetical protein